MIVQLHRLIVYTALERTGARSVLHYAPPKMGGDRIINNGEQCLRLPQSRSQLVTSVKQNGISTVTAFLQLNTEPFIDFHIKLR